MATPVAMPTGCQTNHYASEEIAATRTGWRLDVPEGRMPKTVKIEIFKAGRRTATSGATIDFSDADLSAAAAAYDPSIHEAPLVIGHPTMDAPAYGWVQSVSAEGASLFAEAGEVNVDFAEAVRAGHYKKVSASFYLPGAAANPNPDTYYLRHVGFLGAAAPAVKGLRQVSFADADADADTVTVEFGEEDARDIGMLGRLIGEAAQLLKGIREAKIETDGVEAADKMISPWTLDYITEGAGRITGRADERRSENGPNFSEKEDEVMATQPKDQSVAAREAALQEKEAAFAAQTASFAEREAKLQRDELGRFVDGLVTAGKVLPTTKAGLVDFMAALDSTDTVSFGEGDGKVEKTALDFFKDYLSSQPKAVDFSERAGGDHQAVDFGSGTEGEVAAIEAKAKQIMKDRAAAGDEVSFAEAVTLAEKEIKK